MGNYLGNVVSSSASNQPESCKHSAKKRKHEDDNDEDHDESTLTTIKTTTTHKKSRISFLSAYFNPSPTTSLSLTTTDPNTKIISHLEEETSPELGNHQMSAEAKIASFSSLVRDSSQETISKSQKHTDQITHLLTPQKKKMKSTSLYVYKTLFIEGQQSDIKVKALNREWNLHKIYLCQSPYFATMFQNGSAWKESNQSCIEISIPDTNINEKSLDLTFGSFYKEDVQIVPLEVISDLACASLLSLDGLISQCTSVMKDNINSDSVLAYYEASRIYGVKQVEDDTLKWLCQNLMNTDMVKLDQLNIELFERIISSNQLFIIQVETDLYSLCKRWLYYQLNTVPPKDPTSLLTPKDFNEFFANYLKVCNGGFKTLLEIPCLSKYAQVFKQIRLHNLLNDLSSYELIKQDMLIPLEWIEPCFVENWVNIIYVDQNKFSHEYEIEKSSFDARCLRFGRLLTNESVVTWRWVGFNYGIDILLTHSLDRTINIKRNVPERNNTFMNNSYKGLLSHKSIQRIYYLIKIIKLDKFGTEVWSKETDLVCQDLNKNEEKVAIKIDSNVEYPLILNFNVITHPCN